MVERGGLENRCPFGDRGFESLTLCWNMKGCREVPFFIAIKVRDAQYWRGFEIRDCTDEIHKGFERMIRVYE